MTQVESGRKETAINGSQMRGICNNCYYNFVLNIYVCIYVASFPYEKTEESKRVVCSPKKE